MNVLVPKTTQAPATQALRVDIFCKVIDNFGDIGVCWRLVKQLAALPAGHTVRLWVDDLNRFARIEPRIRLLAEQTVSERITVLHWTADTSLPEPGNVVIEAFSCDPPAAFIQTLSSDAIWLNLEYLSAESWVESCHGLPSLQPNGLRKFFYFPGFTQATGGLLREPDLEAQRTRWLTQPGMRGDLLRRLGVPESLVRAVLNQEARQMVCFGYADAPVAALATALRAQREPWVVLLPQGVCPTLRQQAGDQLHVVSIPFVDQNEFDRLLWSSDVNIVRGEDSLLRALWAQRPMVWDIYRQEDDAHRVKLEAWLQQAKLPDLVNTLFKAWDVRDQAGVATALTQLLQPPEWQRWQNAAAAFSRRLMAQTDLATQLEAFCTQQLRTR